MFGVHALVLRQPGRFSKTGSISFEQAHSCWNVTDHARCGAQPLRGRPWKSLHREDNLAVARLARAVRRFAISSVLSPSTVGADTSIRSVCFAIVLQCDAVGTCQQRPPKAAVMVQSGYIEQGCSSPVLMSGAHVGAFHGVGRPAGARSSSAPSFRAEQANMPVLVKFHAPAPAEWS